MNPARRPTHRNAAGAAPFAWVALVLAWMSHASFAPASDVSLLVACVFPQLLRLSAADNDGANDVLTTLPSGQSPSP